MAGTIARGGHEARCGLSQEQIDAIAERRTPEFDDRDDRLIYEFAHGYYQNHRVSDDIYERMCARWGDKGVVDLAGLIGYYSFVSVTLNVFEVPTPPDAKLLSETPDR
jgi:4-carboxymuconolactone decarboxylase